MSSWLLWRIFGLFRYIKGIGGIDADLYEQIGRYEETAKDPKIGDSVPYKGDFIMDSVWKISLLFPFTMG